MKQIFECKNEGLKKIFVCFWDKSCKIIDFFSSAKVVRIFQLSLFVNQAAIYAYCHLHCKLSCLFQFLFVFSLFSWKRLAVNRHVSNLYNKRQLYICKWKYRSNKRTLLSLTKAITSCFDIYSLSPVNILPCSLPNE